MAVNTPENGAWESVGKGWKQLCGDFSRTGFSIEEHEFTPSKDLDWGRSFHEDSVELCLNLAGTGTVKGQSGVANYRNRTTGFYQTGRVDLQASRSSNEAHAFITVEWSREYLGTQLNGYEDHLIPVVRDWLGKKNRRSTVGEVAPMTEPQEAVFHALRTPPVAPAAYPLWYQSKALELMAGALFERSNPGEMFCERQRRVSRDRVERVRMVLLENLVNPPDLMTLGAKVGCSPFYLSRLFSKEMRMTIPQYVRQIRMQRAAELLREGRHNVTEAALEVGYNSLSHFSKAFWETFGCCPGLYPQGAKLFAHRKLQG